MHFVVWRFRSNADQLVSNPGKLLSNMIQVYRSVLRMENIARIMTEREQSTNSSASIFQNLKPKSFAPSSSTSASSSQKPRGPVVIDLCSDDESGQVKIAEHNSHVQAENMPNSAILTAFHMIAKELFSFVEEFSRFQGLIETLLDVDHLEYIKKKSGRILPRKENNNEEMDEGEEVAGNEEDNNEDTIDLTDTKVSSTSGRLMLMLQHTEYYRIRADFHDDLSSLHAKMVEIEQKILHEYEALLAALSLARKELHLEYSSVHSIHLRVTKRLSTKVTNILNENKISFVVLTHHKAGMLFVTNTVRALAPLSNI
jgi:hypothetical protein